MSMSGYELRSLYVYQYLVPNNVLTKQITYTSTESTMWLPKQLRAHLCIVHFKTGVVIVKSESNLVNIWRLFRASCGFKYSIFVLCAG